MTLEAKLDELIEVNKAILVALQTGAQVSDTSEGGEEKKGRGRPKKDAATTSPAPAPAAETPAATAPAPAGSAPSATPPAATASETTSVSFKEVTDAIVKLNKDTSPNGGRPGVLKVLEKFFGTSEGKKVPMLEELKKNAEIIAFVESLLAPAAADDDLGI